MPVTAKLSKHFYDRLGDQIANELVDWFNQVDTTYRADLRDLNEANFQRFDARLGQRMAELESKLEQRMASLESKLEQRMAQLEATLERRLAAQTRWFFVAWASMLAAILLLVMWLRGRNNPQLGDGEPVA